MRLRIISVFFVAAFVGLLTYMFLPNRPPSEEALLNTFNLNRSVYQRLRDMILADRQVVAVYARFGVETASSGLPHPPPEVHFSSSRFSEYNNWYLWADW
jgi:hypothetical protein